MERFQGINSSVSRERLDGKDCLRVTKDPGILAVDEPTYARLAGPDFRDGTIEVTVLSRLLPGCPDYARGFIGAAFRIDSFNTRFEAIYIRPTNGRAEDQLRRNASIQYFSYPDYKFDRLRQEFPRKFEAYADMGLNEWIRLRIEVRGAKARLFLNDGPQPALIVSELFHGTNGAGAVGLWVDVGTEGYFTDVKITGA